MQKIADDAKLSARQVYDIILSAPPPASGEHTEGKAGGGLGWKTLSQFCADEGIALEGARARLAAKGVNAGVGQTLREIASSSGQKPYELVELLRAKP